MIEFKRDPRFFRAVIRREKEDEELARAIGDMEEEMKQEKQRTEDEKLARRFVQQQEEEKNKKTT